MLDTAPNLDSRVDATQHLDPSGTAAGAPPPRPRRRRWVRWLAGLAVLLAVLASGVVAAGLGLVDHTAAASAPRAALPVPAEVLARYAGDPAFPAVPVLGAEGRDGRHRIVEGKLACKRKDAAEPHDIGVHFYYADGVRGPAPTIVVTPILDGTNKVARIIARDVASHGFHALIVDRRRIEGPERAAGRLESMEEEMRDMVADRMRAIDWLVTLPHVDAARLGAYGVSLGGITTISLSSVDQRIRAAVAVMAGGDLPAVVCRSVEQECIDLARANGVPEGATAAQLSAFEELARPILVTCPFALAPHLDTEQVLLFTTRRDESVPTFTQERLKQALGHPETYSLPTGHYSAVLYIGYMKAKAREFLKRKLAA